MKKILIMIMIAVLTLTTVSCDSDIDVNVNLTQPETTTTTTTALTPPANPNPNPNPGEDGGEEDNGETDTQQNGIYLSAMTADAERVTAQIDETAKRNAVMVIKSDVFSQSEEEVVVTLTIKNEYDSSRTLIGKITDDTTGSFTLAHNLPENYVLEAGASVDITVTVKCVTALEENQKANVKLELVLNGQYTFVTLEGKKTTGGGIIEDGNGGFWTPPY